MRVPLLSGTRVVVVDAPDDAVVLRPPQPRVGIADVGAAVRDALRFPLAGNALEALATRGGSATIVVEPPALPIPGSARDPRQEALAATVDELARAGVATERQTILVAGGLSRRPAARELELLVTPDFARRFDGRVEVHDAERLDLRPLPTTRPPAIRVHPTLIETDLIVVVTAAETVAHGGPAALLAAADAASQRAAGADSLLEITRSPAWELAVELGRALGARAPLMGVSLALNHPTVAGPLHGYPHDPDAAEAIVRSPLRPVYALLPGSVRARVLRALRAECTAAAVFAGPPAVAHAEALLRAIELRATTIERPLGAICLGIPRTTPHLPRERPNPLLAAFLGLGLALRLWRDRFPVEDGGTAMLVQRFLRALPHPTQGPYRAFFPALRSSREPEHVAAAERDLAADRRAVDAYREGRACHPLLPFGDWDACQPALSRLGTVIVAGCRDAVAARQLGFVPAHNVAVALDMARGGGGRGPTGILLSPPYFPLRTGG